MHLCKLNLKFIGLGYRPYSGSGNYNFKTFDLYCCKRCGKIVYKNEESHSHIYKHTYDTQISYVKECGYKSIGELLELKKVVNI